MYAHLHSHHSRTTLPLQQMDPYFCLQQFPTLLTHERHPEEYNRFCWGLFTILQQILLVEFSFQMNSSLSQQYLLRVRLQLSHVSTSPSVGRNEKNIEKRRYIFENICRLKSNLNSKNTIMHSQTLKYNTLKRLLTIYYTNRHDFIIYDRLVIITSLKWVNQSFVWQHIENSCQ